MGKARSNLLTHAAHAYDTTRCDTQCSRPIRNEQWFAAIQKAGVALQNHLAATLVIYKSNYFHTKSAQRYEKNLIYAST